ncbi:hypothetical protein MSAR_38220 [Mycolicibacterium sarraceniae]|uniref:Uncharacterized protein n=1 Tax=Mycolicibacterium sarraceniae TaxID=1534348 RepID=A0A7I7SXZ4_9MYCO|nr:hypothetical protein MSAR_38220 [Mycolicibacterium sarraceniae]
MHCWDATDAIGANEPIEQTLAVEGVDEFVDEVLPGPSRLIPACGQVDVTVRAPISDPLLSLWCRRSPDRVHVEGNILAPQCFLRRVEF